MFAMWLGIGSIIMMFAGFTSAYIVRRAGGNWVEYKLPDLFWVSTVVILLSSITLYIAHKAFKSDNRQRYRLFLGITLLLGLGFVGLQYAGWKELMGYGILLEGNPSGAFLYVISGMHAAHVLGGILFLVIFFIKSLRNLDPVKKLMQDINPEKTLGVDIMATYWHFVDILWIYLFVFFLYYR